MAVVVARALGIKGYDGDYPLFADVMPGHWAYDEINALGQLGIVNGRGGARDGRTPSLQYEPDYQESVMNIASKSDKREIQGLGGTVTRTGSKSVKPSFYGPNQPITRGQSAAILASFLGLSDYTGPQIFNDVAPDNWAYGAIGALYQAGIIQGYTNPNVFMPSDTNTRAGMAVMLGRALGLEPVYPAQPIFPDVPNDYWAAGYINALAQAGIFDGYPDGTFGPELAMARDQEAVILYRAYNYKYNNPLALYQGDQIFVDVPPDYWAYGYIGAVYNAGITDGIETPFFREETIRYGRIGPEKPVTVREPHEPRDPPDRRRRLR
jgi:hypothetical protein